MDKKTSVLIAVLASLISLSIAATYYKYVILHDYDVYYDDYSEVDIESE